MNPNIELASLTALLGTLKEKNKIARNKKTSGEELIRIFNSLSENLDFENQGLKEFKIAKEVFLHPNCPASLLLKGAKHKKPAIVLLALKHKNFPVIVLNDLIKKNIEKKRYAKIFTLMQNPNFPQEFFKNLEQTTYSPILEWMAQKYHNPKWLEKTFIKPTKHQQIALINNPACPFSLLKSFFSHWWFEKNFVLHPNLTLEMRHKALEKIKNKGLIYYQTLSEEVKEMYG